MRRFRAGRGLVLAGAAAGLCAAGLAQQGKAPSHAVMVKADAAFRAGYAAQQAGRLEEARTKFAEAAGLAPGIAEGREALGVILLELHRAAEAVPELEAAAKLKPKDRRIETNLAYALVRAGQPEKALPHFEAVVHLGGGGQGRAAAEEAAFDDAYARALAAAGKREEALEEFAAEEKLTGPRADLDDAQGTVLAQMGRWDEARSAFEKALREDGAYEKARVHLGVLKRQQNDLAGSIETLEAATQGAPADAGAFFEYGRSLAAAGKDEEAGKAFQETLKLNPQYPHAAEELGMALQRLGRQQEAIPWFEKAVAADPRNEGLLSNLGLALSLTGRGKEALEYLARAEQENPKDPSVYKDKGVVHVQLAAFDEGIEDFKAGLALDPKDPQLHYDLGLAYKFKDRLDDSVAEMEKAEAMDPQLEDPPYTLGITLMQMGKLDRAVTELRKAVALRADNGAAWAILGSTLKQAGRLDEAAEALKQAIPLQPGQPGPRITLAGVLAEQAANLSTQAEEADAAGDQAKAEELRGKVKALRSEVTEYRKEGAELSRAAVSRQRASFALNAGNQLLLKGQIAEAVSRYQESVAADPTFADPHAQLALAYERQGRVQEAAAERAKAAELQGGGSKAERREEHP